MHSFFCSLLGVVTFRPVHAACACRLCMPLSGQRACQLPQSTLVNGHTAGISIRTMHGSPCPRRVSFRAPLRAHIRDPEYGNGARPPPASPRLALHVAWRLLAAPRSLALLIYSMHDPRARRPAFLPASETRARPRPRLRDRETETRRITEPPPPDPPSVTRVIYPLRPLAHVHATATGEESSLRSSVFHRRYIRVDHADCRICTRSHRAGVSARRLDLIVRNCPSTPSFRRSVTLTLTIPQLPSTLPRLSLKRPSTLPAGMDASATVLDAIGQASRACRSACPQLLLLLARSHARVARQARGRDGAP